MLGVSSETGLMGGRFVLDIFFVVWHSEDVFKSGTGMKVGSDS